MGASWGHFWTGSLGLLSTCEQVSTPFSSASGLSHYCGVKMDKPDCLPPGDQRGCSSAFRHSEGPKVTRRVDGARTRARRQPAAADLVTLGISLPLPFSQPYFLHTDIETISKNLKTPVSANSFTVQIYL